MGDDFGNPVGLVDLLDPFGEIAEGLPVVDFLKGFAALHMPADLADEQEHRRRILLSDMHAAGRVGGAGAARDQRDAGPAGHLAVGLGHDRRATLMARHDRVDRRVMEPVQHVEIAFAGHAENPRYALGLKAPDQAMSAGYHGHSSGKGAARGAPD